MKTNSDKFIAQFVETGGLKSRDGGKTWDGKQVNKVIVFYLL